MNVERALSGITPAQLNEWWTYYRLEPWGDDWVQTAKIEAAIRQAAGENVSPADLIPNEDNRKDDEVEDAALGDRWRAKLGF